MAELSRVFWYSAWMVVRKGFKVVKYNMADIKRGRLQGRHTGGVIMIVMQTVCIMSGKLDIILKK
jgi:hypothetical protein